MNLNLPEGNVCVCVCVCVNVWEKEKLRISIIGTISKKKILWIIYLLHSIINFNLVYFATAISLQSCPTLCNPIDGSPPGSAIPGILQARTLEWVVISFSRAWKWKVKVKSLSHVQLLATPWTAAYQTPPSMGLSRQGYWRGVPLPSPLGMYTHVLRILL